MGIFSSSKKEKSVLLFHIGTGSIGTSLVTNLKQSDKYIKPNVIYSSRTPFSFKENLSFSEFVEEMVKSLETSLRNFEKAKLPPPDAIHCVLASPWYVSQTRVIQIEKNVPFVYTKKFEEDLVKKEIERFATERNLDTGEKDGGAQVIDKQIIQIKLNGYSYVDPYEKKAKKAELAIFLSVSPTFLIERIRNTIKKTLNAKSVFFSSFVFMSFIVFRDIYKETKDFLIIDVGSEVTDIAFVRNDLLEGSTSFPSGKNFILRRLVAGLKMSNDEVVSLMQLYQDGNIETGMKERIDKFLLPAKNEWLKHFQNSLFTLSNNLTLPDAIFLTAGENLVRWFQDTITKEEFNQYVLTKKKFLVVTADKSTLLSFCTPGCENANDPFMLLESIFISRMHNINHA